MRTLIESLYGILSYMTEECTLMCEHHLGKELSDKLNQVCTELGEWLEQNK